MPQGSSFLASLSFEPESLGDSPDGEEFIITQDGEPKARLCAVPVACRKNGILVHHTGHAISSEDVARSLAGE
jgi:hypothetical protein